MLTHSLIYKHTENVRQHVSLVKVSYVLVNPSPRYRGSSSLKSQRYSQEDKVKAQASKDSQEPYNVLLSSSV